MIIILATKFENCWPREFLIWLHAFNEYFLDHEMISKGTINSGKDGGFQVKEELWQCVKGFCCYSVAKLWPTLCNFKAVAHQALLSSTVSQSLLKLMSVMTSNRLFLCHPLYSCPQSFLGSFPVSQLFASGGQSIKTSVSALLLPVIIQGWIPLGLIGLISLQSKGLSGVFSSTTIWKHQFFSAQPSLWSNYHKLLPLIYS